MKLIDLFNELKITPDKLENLEVEVYVGTGLHARYFHTDSIDYVSTDEISEYLDCEVETYEYMTEEDYNKSVCANDIMSYQDTHYDQSKVLCILISRKDEN